MTRRVDRLAGGRSPRRGRGDARVDRSSSTATRSAACWTYARRALAGARRRAAPRSCSRPMGAGSPPTGAARRTGSWRSCTRARVPTALEWMPDPWDDVAASGALAARARGARPPRRRPPSTATRTARCPFRAPKLVVGHSCVAVVVRGGPRRARRRRQWDRYRAAVRAGLRGAGAVVAPTRVRCARALERHYGPIPAPNGRAERPRRVAVLARAEGAVRPRGGPAVGRGEERRPRSRASRRACPGRSSWRGTPRVPTSTWSVAPAATRAATLLGRLGEEELARWLARAAIFALPARYEPFGLSVLEAALSGCALVLGDLASLREIWDGAAVFVPPGRRRPRRPRSRALVRDARAAGRASRAARARRAPRVHAGADGGRATSRSTRALARGGAPGSASRVKLVLFVHSLPLRLEPRQRALPARRRLRARRTRPRGASSSSPRDAWSAENLVRDHGAARARRAGAPRTPSSPRRARLRPRRARPRRGARRRRRRPRPRVERAGAGRGARRRARAPAGGYRLLFHDTHHRAVTDPEEMAPLRPVALRRRARLRRGAPRPLPRAAAGRGARGRLARGGRRPRGSGRSPREPATATSSGSATGATTSAPSELRRVPDRAGARARPARARATACATRRRRARALADAGHRATAAGCRTTRCRARFARAPRDRARAAPPVRRGAARHPDHPRRSRRSPAASRSSARRGTTRRGCSRRARTTSSPRDGARDESAPARASSTTPRLARVARRARAARRSSRATPAPTASTSCSRSARARGDARTAAARPPPARGKALVRGAGGPAAERVRATRLGRRAGPASSRRKNGGSLHSQLERAPGGVAGNGDHRAGVSSARAPNPPSGPACRPPARGRVPAACARRHRASSWPLALALAAVNVAEPLALRSLFDGLAAGRAGGDAAGGSSRSSSSGSPARPSARSRAGSPGGRASASSSGSPRRRSAGSTGCRSRSTARRAWGR